MKTAQVLSIAICACSLGLISGCSSDPTAVGSAIPEFKVSVPNDLTQTVSRTDLKGKVTLIDFWATWCGSCREEMPILERIYKQNKEKGLQVVAVSQEKTDAILRFESVTQVDLPFYVDQDGVMNRDFNIIGLPTTLVVGKDGTVVYSSMGIGPTDETDLQSAISKALSS